MSTCIYCKIYVLTLLSYKGALVMIFMIKRKKDGYYYYYNLVINTLLSNKYLYRLKLLLNIFNCITNNNKRNLQQRVDHDLNHVLLSSQNSTSLLRNENEQLTPSEGFHTNHLHCSFLL